MAQHPNRLFANVFTSDLTTPRAQPVGVTNRMSTFHLAQINIACARAPLDSPVMTEFMIALDEINALADSTPGFVWRLKGDDGNATTYRPYADLLTIVNLSVRYKSTCSVLRHSRDGRLDPHFVPERKIEQIPGQLVAGIN